MKDISYVISIWIIGVFVSPIIVYFFLDLKDEFFTIYMIMVFFGAKFSLFTLFIFIGVYFMMIRQNLESNFNIKFATNIAVVILSAITFFIAFYWLNFFGNEVFLISIVYILTMSVAVWFLKLKP